ncbi:MAG TPA: sialidase family protein [Micromonosporaceae bacterium]|nr:sialidase family protein [Micromonosporaceae bacterium]
MPDTRLDQQRAASRAQLLAEIDQPDLARVRERAQVLRRRRTVARAGGGLALLATAALVAVTAQPWAGRGPEVATTPGPVPSGGPVWTDAGITVNGMVQPYVDLPGDIVDVELVDPDRGYALLAGCVGGRSCRMTVASTRDGGLTWTEHPLPAGAAIADIPPELLLFPDGSAVVTVQPPLVLTAESGWQPRPGTGGPVTTAERGARLRVRPGPSRGCAGAVVEVWTSGYGHRGDLANQPPIDVCWVAAQPAADGAWWVGGADRATGQPAVSVSRDSGRTWQRPQLPGAATGAPAGTSVRVATLGTHAYAVVTGPGGQLGAVYHSVDGGRSFTRTRPGPDGEPATLAGDPVPVLDGRLLVATLTGRWFVSSDAGATFVRTDELPEVGRLVRGPSGYVALDLFGNGWAAYSSDGATWRKLHLR